MLVHQLQLKFLENELCGHMARRDERKLKLRKKAA